MKKIFFEYHMKDKEIYNYILTNSLIVLDTNSLLNLYRYSLDTRPKFFEILSKISDRLIMPYQVGYEFYENREKIIHSKTTFENHFTEFLKDEINALSEKIKNSNTSGKYANVLALLKHEEALKNSLIEKLANITIDLIDCLKNYNNDISHSFIYGEDSILKNLLDLYDDKVSDKLSDEQLKNICAEGQKRYDLKVPPGYKDKDKPEPNKFGDLIIWNEMIEISKKYNKDILFISDDRKEDWCHKFEGKDLGSRRELIKEFHKETNCYFFSITPLEFIQEISTMYNIQDLNSLKEETQIIEDNLHFEENSTHKMLSLINDYMLNELHQKKYYSNSDDKDYLDLISNNDNKDEELYNHNFKEIYNDSSDSSLKLYHNQENLNNENCLKHYYIEHNNYSKLSKKNYLLNLLKNEEITKKNYIDLLKLLDKYND